jgi:hypothetical protein
MKYLGMPVDEKKLVVSQWAPVEEKFAKKNLWMERKFAFNRR